MSWFSKKTTDELPAPPPEAAPPAVPSSELPEIEQLTEVEFDWVRSMIAELSEQDVRADDIEDLGRHYDELLTAWLRVRATDRPEPDKIVDQIGLAFGQYLADHGHLEWVIAIDQQGPGIALYRAQGPVLLRPTDMVAEAWVARRTGVLAALAQVTLEGLEPSS